ncbi:MAG: DUF1697 domain-containing protein [Maribacter sp.]
MPTYIALLRGINVSGQKKIKMIDLKAMLISIGFQDVETYIQSGNVIFKSDENNIKSLEEKIKKGIADTFGFDVPVLVKTRAGIVEILQESPFTKPEDLEAKRIYYALLKYEPEQDAIANLAQKDYPNELFSITKYCVYLNCLNGAGKAKLTNNVIERKLKVSATTRNHRTMLKLLELSKEN